MANQGLLTVDEMAAHLKVKKSWLYLRTMQTGPDSMPRKKIGKYLRFNPDEVWEWIERQNQVR